MRRSSSAAPAARCGHVLVEPAVGVPIAASWRCESLQMLQAERAGCLEALVSAAAVGQIVTTPGYGQLLVDAKQQRQLVGWAAFILLGQAEGGQQSPIPVPGRVGGGDGGGGGGDRRVRDVVQEPAERRVAEGG